MRACVRVCMRACAFVCDCVCVCVSVCVTPVVFFLFLLLFGFCFSSSFSFLFDSDNSRLPERDLECVGEFVIVLPTMNPVSMLCHTIPCRVATLWAFMCAVASYKTQPEMERRAIYVRRDARTLCSVTQSGPAQPSPAQPEQSASSA